MQSIITLFIYPGLGLALGLSVLYTVLTAQHLRMRGDVIRAAWRSTEGLLHLVSILLTSISLTLLPWPLHPTPSAAAAWVWVWAVLEGAFLLPLLPGLLSGAPFVVRAASREAQVGVMGRMLLWIALSVGLTLGDGWQFVTLPATLLAALAAIFAFPAAVGWGPYAPEVHLTPGGAEHGLDSGTAALSGVARSVRTAVLLAVSLVALVPTTPLLQPWLRLTLLATLFIGVSILLRQISGLLPLLPLPMALRTCWWRSLPLGIAAVVYLAVVSGL